MWKSHIIYTSRKRPRNQCPLSFNGGYIFFVFCPQLHSISVGFKKHSITCITMSNVFVVAEMYQRYTSKHILQYLQLLYKWLFSRRFYLRYLLKDIKTRENNNSRKIPSFIILILFSWTQKLANTFDLHISEFYRLYSMSTRTMLLVDDISTVPIKANLSTVIILTAVHVIRNLWSDVIARRDVWDTKRVIKNCKSKKDHVHVSQVIRVYVVPSRIFN